MAENKNAQQVREITDKLEQGIKELFESEKFKEYLTTMSKFYNYSFNNTLLIAMQKPDATLIAGYTSWQRNFDRHVMKGEKGIKILAPAPYKAQEEREKIDPATQKPMLDADGKPVTETVEVMRPAFKVVSVFDVSQTDGKELPDIAVDELTGSVENYAAFFEALKQESPVPISFEDIPGGAKGYFSHAENRIAIQDGMSEIQTVKTAIHEIAHAKLHAINPDEKVAPEERKDRHTKEVEAESVAYTVCQRYGIETSDYSFGYIAGWSSDKDTKELKGSLETIRSTAAEMIESIDAKLKVLLAEKTQEQINTQAWDKEVALESEGKGFVEVHETDEGFDYSIYGPDMKLIDGGVIENTETTAYKVAMTLCEENGFEKPSIVFNYQAFQEQAAAANEIKPSFLEVPVYREMANYAYEAGELDAYRASRDANIACKEAIEAAISENFSNNHLSTEAAVTSVFEQFSPERVQYVLANTIQHKDHDGRIHQSLKDWAKEIEVCPEDANFFIVDKVNPGLVSLFVIEVNRQVEEMAREAEELLPVYDRETEILYDVLADLEMKDIELSFDADGLVASDGQNTWHGAELYKFIIDEAQVFWNASTPQALEEVLSSDFRELAEHNGVSFPEKPPEKEAPKHRLTPEEKKIKDAVMDTLKAQIAYSNDGMRATYKASDQSHKIMAQNKVKIEGNTVTQNGEPMFAIHRRHSAKKTQGCYRELTPTLEYIKKEKAQETKHEKPSIREQLKAAKAQSEKKAPTQEKKPKSKEMEI